MAAVSANDRTIEQTLRSAVLGSAPAGQRVQGRYRLLRLRCAGGMGAVYEALDERTERSVALKLMHPFLAADPDARQRFVQEGEVARTIDHPNVVRVFDAGVDGATGVPFLVMELLTGRDLGELLRERGALPAREVLGILTQVARALDRAHALRIVHRDLKPQNVFVAGTPHGGASVRVLDFGIAKVLSPASASETRAAGTPSYMAPEQTRRSSSIGPSTDVWSFGLLAFTMLVGRSYWVEEETAGVLAEILVHPLEPASARARRFGAKLPRGFDAWFAGCVSRDPALRYASVGEAVTALSRVIVGSEGLGVSSTLASSHAPRVSAHAPTLVDPCPFGLQAQPARPPSRLGRGGGRILLAAGMGLLVGVLSTLLAVSRASQPAGPTQPAGAITEKPRPQQSPPPPPAKIATGERPPRRA